MATNKQENAKKKFARNQQIVASLRAGWNARQVADEYGLSYSWSKKLCSRLRKGDKGERKPGSGRPRKTVVREDRFLIREAVRQCDASNVCPSMADLSEALKDRTSTQISRQTVQRRLHERNYKKCLKTRKPFVSSVNRLKRLKFAKLYHHWTVDQWKVVWSDEPPFVLHCQNGSYVWRLGKQQFSPRCLQGTVKHQN
jgi:transposase